jgi:ABC-type transporter Mla subunit MlaD
MSGYGFDEAARWGKLWMDLTAQVMAADLTAEPGAAPGDAARQVRSAVFDVMARAADQFMRSPEFLELIKQASQASNAYMKQVNHAMTGLRHRTQGLARQDMDEVSRLIRHAEQRLLDRMEELSLKVDDLADDVRQMQDGEGAETGAAPSARAGRTARPPRRAAAASPPLTSPENVEQAGDSQAPTSGEPLPPQE